MPRHPESLGNVFIAKPPCSLRGEWIRNFTLLSG